MQIERNAKAQDCYNSNLSLKKKNKLKTETHHATLMWQAKQKAQIYLNNWWSFKKS